MSKYKLFETQQYSDDVENIADNVKKSILAKIMNYVYPQIIVNPYFGINIKKLKNYSPSTWRYRIGDYRLFYEINEGEKTINIIGIDLRKDVY